MSQKNIPKIMKKYKKPTAKPFWRGRTVECSKEMQRIVVVHTAFLGDMILATAMIRAIHDICPHAEIDAVAIPQTVVALQGNPHVKNIYVFDKRDRKKKQKEFKRLASQLRQRQYDAAIIPHRSMTTARLIKKAGVRVKIGFSRPWFSFLYYDVRVLFRHGLYEIERHLDLLRPLLPAQEHDPFQMSFPMNWKTELFPGEKNRQTGQKVLEDLEKQGHQPKNPLIAVAPGSVWFTKKWPEQHFATLVNILVHNNASVILLGGPEDRELCQRIMPEHGRAVNTAGHASILDSAALIEHCHLVICNDSAPLHIANAMETPVMAIFGATSPIFGFGPHGANDIVIENNDLYCHPCRSHGSSQCPEKHFRCMRDISPEMVWQKAKSFFDDHDRNGRIINE